MVWTVQDRTVLLRFAIRFNDPLNCAILISKTKQDICWIIGPLIVFWGIALFAYYYTSNNPTLTSGVGLISAVILTVGGIIVMYIGDKLGRPFEIGKR
jgi:hypothetical protein